MSEPSSTVSALPGFDPSRLSHHEQMLDAEKGCVPCKLCGGRAVISDAGYGAGYYIRCGNSRTFRYSEGCLIDERRLGGWAYNVRDWWNRLHAIATEARRAETENTGSVHDGAAIAQKAQS
jgi:hypothetical protein